MPDRIDALLTLKGVGRKTANLVVTMGFGKPGICVDVHVHRISNRWGFIQTRTPAESETALRARLPRRYWIGYNDSPGRLSARTSASPCRRRCSICPVAVACPRVGVTRSPLKRPQASSARAREASSSRARRSRRVRAAPRGRARRSHHSSTERKAAEISSAPQRPAGLYHL